MGVDELNNISWIRSMIGRRTVYDTRASLRPCARVGCEFLEHSDLSRFLGDAGAHCCQRCQKGDLLCTRPHGNQCEKVDQWTWKSEHDPKGWDM